MRAPPDTPNARAISRFPVFPWAEFRNSRICSLLGSPPLAGARAAADLPVGGAPRDFCFRLWPLRVSWQRVWPEPIFSPPISSLPVSQSFVSPVRLRLHYRILQPS
jgi:hypothetical protein